MARRKAKKVASDPVADRLAQMEAVAADFNGWGQAEEVLTEIRSIQTVFPGFDVATRVKGLPLQRVIVVHGPSNHGKTTFVMGLGLSALRAGMFYGHVDAEHTTPKKWVQQLMREMSRHPGFVAKRPQNFEEVRDDVADMLTKIIKKREAGKLPADIGALIAVDSQRKLVPKDIYAKLAKGEGGVDGMGGRAGQIRAAATAAWLDEVVPLFYRANATLVIIARETANPDKKNKFDKDYRVSGGASLNYDSSLTCRIERASWVKASTAEDAPIIGERHRCTIAKTKIGGKDGKITRCYFHSSNGEGDTPAGFDYARDVAEMAIAVGRLKQKGSWYTDTETGESWQGLTKVVNALASWDEDELHDFRNEVQALAQPDEVADMEGEE